MVTEIAGLGYPVVGQAVTAALSAVVTASDSGGVSVVAAGSNPQSTSNLQPSQSTQVAATFSRSQEQKALLDNAATSLRDTGEVVQKTLGLLDQTKQSLSQIVKMWPPYPAGSAQREAILNQVSGLRKMVEALTFPPQESLKQVGQVLGPQSASTGSTGIQGVAATVQSGMSGLATLDPGSASDVAVGQALSQVDALHSKLQEMSTGMWRDVVNFVAQAGSPEVQKQGTGVGQQLAGLNAIGIGSNGPLLQQATESK